METTVIEIDLTKKQNTIPLGKRGERNATALKFSIPEYLADGDIYLDFDLPNGVKFTTEALPEDKMYYVPVELLATSGIGKMDVVFRSSNIKKVVCQYSAYISPAINVTPIPPTQWITVAPANSVQKSRAMYVLDGTDDAATLNSIISSLPNGGKIAILDGLVKIKSPIRPMANISLIGSGKRSTIIDVPDDVNAFENTEVMYKSALSDFGIRGSAIALNLFMDTSTLENIFVENARLNALKLNYAGFDSEDTKYLNKIQHCDLDSQEDAVLWGWRTADSWFCYNNVSSKKANIVIEGSTARFIGNHFDGSPEYNVYCPNGAQWMFFEDNIMEAASKNSVYFRRPDWDTAAFSITLNNNIIRNNGGSGDGYDMVRIDGYSTESKAQNIMIQNNNMIISEAFRRVPHCISIQNCSTVSITGNLFDGYVEDNAIQLVDVDGAVISGNAGGTNNVK